MSHHRNLGAVLQFWHRIGAIDEYRWWCDAEYHARWYRLAGLVAA